MFPFDSNILKNTYGVNEVKYIYYIVYFVQPCRSRQNLPDVNISD